MRDGRNRARRISSKGGVGKIENLRREARHDLGKWAECLLAMLGNESQETDAEFIRAFVGAALLAETMHDVRQIKRLLTPKKK